MRRKVISATGIVLVLFVLAGCAAPATTPPATSQTSTTPITTLFSDGSLYCIPSRFLAYGCDTDIFAPSDKRNPGFADHQQRYLRDTPESA